MKKLNLGMMMLVAMLILVGTAMAHRNGGGMMSDSAASDGYGFCDRYADVDPDEVTAITGKYAAQFDALQEKLQAKRDEMHTARSQDTTTVGQLNTLRAEMQEIKQERAALDAKVDTELGAKFGVQATETYCGKRKGHHGQAGMMGGESASGNCGGRGNMH